jgi:hypothetical protein
MSLSFLLATTLSSLAPAPETRTDDHGRRAATLASARVRSSSAADGLVPANWKGLGPFGGDIADVQASPANASLVLAAFAPASGGGGGMFRSTNAGGSWARVAQLDGLPVYKVAFAPDGTAYAGTLDAVWKSTDGGASWTQKPLGIGLNDQVLEVAIDPANAAHVWIGVADALGNQPVNVMDSPNGGTNWFNKTPPLGSAISCTGIVVHPTDPNRVYACFAGDFGGGEVWVSSTAGGSWTNRSAGLPNNPMKDLVHDGARVLLVGGQLFGGQAVGAYASPDEGVTWNPLHDGTWPNLAIQTIALDPNNASTILVGSAGSGVFRSTNGGVNWSFGVGGTGALSVNSVAFSPGSSSVIYTGSSSFAVWKSTNGGGSFAPSSSGISNLDVFSIAANPRNPAELAIAFQGLNNGGVFSSFDAGGSWTPEGVPGTRFSTVYFAPDGRLYALSDGPSSIAPEGVYRRDGTIWTSIGPDQGSLFETELYAIQVSENDPDLVFAGGNDFGVAGFESTIWRRVSGIWTKTFEGPSNRSVRDLEIVTPSNDRKQVAVFVDQSGGSAGGVLRSGDVAATWQPSSTGLPGIVQCTSLSTGPGGLYLSNNAASGAGQGVYKSTDGGQSWNGTGYPGTAVSVVADPVDPMALYIADQNGPGNVLASSDGGAVFTPYDQGLSQAGFVRAMERAPDPGRDLLLATLTGSFSTVIAPFTIFCSGDGTTPTPCPCDNTGGEGRGCANSVNAAGGLLSPSGATSPDTVVLTASGLPSTSLTAFFQGDHRLFSGALFGDGVRCVGGHLVRLGSSNASSGSAAYPGAGDPTISQRSAAVGDPLAPGDVRFYQAQYRNSDPSFCPSPTGSTFNTTNAVRVQW